MTRLVPGSTHQAEERAARRDRMRKHKGHTLLKPEDDSEKSDSKRNRHSWHVTSTSTTSSALTFDQTSFEGFPGEPHSGNNGVPHGDYRKSWHVSSPTRASSVTSGPVIHQSSCPSSFYRQDKPKRNFKLPLRTESCPNPSHNHCVVLEPDRERRIRPQNLNFEEQISPLEIGATSSNEDIASECTNVTKCRQNRRQNFLSKSGKQEAFDEDDITLDATEALKDINVNDVETKVNDSEDPATDANLWNNNGSCNVSKGGRTMRCKDCGGRIVVSITTPTPTSSAPRIYRLKR